MKLTSTNSCLLCLARLPYAPNLSGLQPLLALLMLFISPLSYCDLYSDNGIEISKRPWDQLDYMTFADALANGDIPLPSSNDEQSQHVFRKLVNKKNLALLDNSEIDSEEKFYFIVDLIDALGSVAEIYALSMSDTDVINNGRASDFADIVLFTHELTLKAYLLFQQDMEKYPRPKDNPLHQHNQDISQMIKKSMFGMLALGAAPDLLPEKSRLKLCSQFRESAKNISGSLDNDIKNELLVAIKMVYAHPNTRVVQSYFRDAEKRLR